MSKNVFIRLPIQIKNTPNPTNFSNKKNKCYLDNSDSNKSIILPMTTTNKINPFSLTTPLKNMPKIMIKEEENLKGELRKNQSIQQSNEKIIKPKNDCMINSSKKENILSSDSENGRKTPKNLKKFINQTPSKFDRSKSCLKVGFQVNQNSNSTKKEKFKISFEKLLIIEDKIWQIHEGLKDQLNVNIFCRELWILSKQEIFIDIDVN